MTCYSMKLSAICTQAAVTHFVACRPSISPSDRPTIVVARNSSIGSDRSAYSGRKLGARRASMTGIYWDAVWQEASIH